MTTATSVTVATVSNDPQTYEDAHVHSVYDEIAPHFSSTRYKPWPIIARFLSSLPAGWVGLDSGTGNGKYLPIPLDRPGNVWTIGLDKSRNLLGFARSAGGETACREVVWGDALGQPWRIGAFDYAISIATIHHLSTHVRRRLAVQRLLECISPSHGRALIYVWAIEQDELSKRNIPADNEVDSNVVTSQAKDSRGQDVFVPWVLSSQNQPQQPKPKYKKRRDKTQEDEKQNAQPDATTHDPLQQARVYNRYYHMFAEGELLELVAEAVNALGWVVGSPSDDECNGGHATRGIEIVESGWERSNYYVELRRWELQQ